MSSLKVLAMLRKGRKPQQAAKEETGKDVMNVTASMKGNLSFRDPVNLCIDGDFEGELNIKGTLTIGENAVVNAKINGETIIISGKVKGDVIAKDRLELVGSAQVIGNIKTPILSVREGAALSGECEMPVEEVKFKSEELKRIARKKR